MQIYHKNDSTVFDMVSDRGAWEQWFLLQSDVHFDSTHCDRAMLKRHMDQAKERNAKVCIFGDLFDCMGGKYDPRSTKADIRPEYMHTNYFDAIVKDAAEFYRPYKDNLALITDGNHETTVLLKHEISLLDNLVERIGGDCLRGKYAGFLRFKFKIAGTRSSQLMFWTHGSGGSSPVTKGTIGSARRQEMIQAQYYVSGHQHSEWELPRTITTVNDNGSLQIMKCFHWQLGCYQQSHMKGGWADSKGFAAPSIGARWIRFYSTGKQVKMQSFLTD